MAPNLRAVPAQYTTDGSVFPSADALEKVADIARMRVGKAADFANRTYGPDAVETKLIAEIRDRKSSVESEQVRLRALFRRWDNLYMPGTITTGGPDHWPEAITPGRVHVSNNIYHAYVDIPSALQAYEPVENYVAEDVTPERRDSANRAEHLYTAWKAEDEFELKFHRAAVIKALYGITFGKVYWDANEKRPTLTILESPENLYVGWGNSDFSRMDWAIYCYGLSKQAIEEDYGLGVGYEMDPKSETYFPYVSAGTHDDPIGNVYGSQDNWRRPRPQYEMGQIEVYDYWYKKPTPGGKPATIWNAIFVGNRMVKNAVHKEYDSLPYEPLRNTFVPGIPYGKSELYDLEQLIREKDERMTNAGQMLGSITDGQRWQLVGPEAPDDLPPNAVPQANKVATPGPNAKIEAIQPFVAEYQIESYMSRLDHELETASGLNDLLLGRAPATILGSSKAIAALISNYESRIRMKRDLLYQWRKRIWRVTAKVWEVKDPKVKAIIDGQYRIAVRAPELTPHDNTESAQLAMSLVQNRLWSAERAMTETGVDDPLSEKAIIREEQTDPGLNPAAVQAQVTLVGALRAQGIDPAAAGVPGAQSPDQQANTARTLTPPVSGTPALNQAQSQGNPPATSLPANALAPNGAPAPADVPFGQQSIAVNKSRLVAGQVTGRIDTQTPLKPA